MVTQERRGGLESVVGCIQRCMSRQFIPVLALLLQVVLVQELSVAQEQSKQNSDTTLSELVQEFVALTVAQENGTSKPSDLKRIKEARGEFRDNGSVLVSYVRQSPEVPRSSFVASRLLSLLARETGIEVEEFMLHTLLHSSDQQLRVNAGAYFDWMSEQGKQTEVELSQEDLERFTHNVQTASPLYATVYLNVLPALKTVSIEQRVSILMERIATTLAEETFGKNPTVYLSPKVHALSEMVKTAGLFKEPIIQILELHRQKARDNQDLDLEVWITLSLAAAGAGSTIPDVEKIIQEHYDPSVRCAAIPIYAKLAGTRAIPVLKESLKDRSLSNYKTHPRYRKEIRFVAHAAVYALVDLGEPAPNEDDFKTILGVGP